MAKELNEDTGFHVSIKTLIAIGFAMATIISMWFILQADIAEAKELPVPQKIAKQDAPRESLGSNPTAGTDRAGAPIPSTSYLNSNKLSSWNPLKGAWDTRNRNSINEIRSLGIASERYAITSREWNAYNKNVKDVETNTQSRTAAAQKKKLKAIASKRNGASKAISRAKGSRGGLSRAGGLRGGSR